MLSPENSGIKIVCYGACKELQGIRSSQDSILIYVHSLKEEPKACVVQ
ncbi:hypothetical protein P3X46_001226 [Hevea brasiliensis]|uniref:Uncharacterized protein n=1 Tax=Hevea brasiliensis TaxID=3981 RepID=A0ABQ9NE92_HEVBR|nr:hypothetical protein P3X46_001226 [Hevea brasiliensis]